MALTLRMDLGIEAGAPADASTAPSSMDAPPRGEADPAPSSVDAPPRGEADPAPSSVDAPPREEADPAPSSVDAPPREEADPAPSSMDAPPRGEADQPVTQVQPPPSSPPSSKKGPRARRCPTCDQAFSGEARFCPFDGDPLKDADDWNPSADPLIGQIIDGRYEVVDVLGEGGMGTVYEVRHTTLGRRFALKVLRRDIADAEHTARFIQEAKAAAAIGHPNIVAVSDFGEVKLSGPSGPAVPYFVMELLTGISLAALLRAEKTLSPERTSGILIQCAAGLAAAHAAGVIHRDLKPDNVFLTRNGDREFVKLLDFGVAKMAGAGRLTRAGMVFGTPHYMSPEQAAGQNVDHRADVYALGVILYECFAGKVPFEADTYMGVLTKHMFATPEPIEHLAPDASKLGALGPIVMRCLAKNPQDRFASMAEVGAAIELAMSDPPRAATMGLSERPPGSGSLRLGDADRFEGRVELPQPPSGRPMLVPVAIGLGVLVIGLIGLVTWMETHKSNQNGKNLTEPAPTAAVSAAPMGDLKTAAPVEPSATPTGASSALVESPSSSNAAASSSPHPSATPSAPIRNGSGTARSADPVKTTRPKRPGGGEVVDPWAH